MLQQFTGCLSTQCYHSQHHTKDRTEHHTTSCILCLYSCLSSFWSHMTIVTIFLRFGDKGGREEGRFMHSCYSTQWGRAERGVESLSRPAPFYNQQPCKKENTIQSRDKRSWELSIKKCCHNTFMPIKYSTIYILFIHHIQWQQIYLLFDAEKYGTI
jgi:hypothetical protein